MGQLVLLVVAAAWAAVLIPPLLRSRVENRPNSSVTDFRRQLNRLQSTVPVPRRRLPAPGRPARSPRRRCSARWPVAVLAARDQGHRQAHVARHQRVIGCHRAPAPCQHPVPARHRVGSHPVPGCYDERDVHAVPVRRGVPGAVRLPVPAVAGPSARHIDVAERLDAPPLIAGPDPGSRASDPVSASLAAAHDHGPDRRRSRDGA
jgi:hypothetical protein